MEIADRDRAGLPAGRYGLDPGVEPGHGDRHVGGMHRDAGFARAKYGVHAIEALKRRAARTRLALVARHVAIVEVGAARSLQEIAAGRGLVAYLAGRSRQQR